MSISIPFTHPRNREPRLIVEEEHGRPVLANYFMAIPPATRSHAMLDTLTEEYQLVSDTKNKIVVPPNWRKHVRDDWDLKTYRKMMNRRAFVRSSIETLWSIGFIDCIDVKPFKRAKCKVNDLGVKAKKILDNM